METNNKPISKTSKWVALIMIGCFFIFFMYLCSDDSNEVPNTENVKLTRTDSILLYFDKTDGSCTLMVNKLFNQLNDPDSYQHVETKYYDLKDNQNIMALKNVKPDWFKTGGLIYNYPNSFYVLMKYRGKNSFGALVLENAEGIFSIDDGECLYFNVFN